MSDVAYRSGCNCVARGESAKTCAVERQLISGHCGCECHPALDVKDLTLDPQAFQRVSDAFDQTPCQRGFHFNPDGENWCVRCRAELDDHGRSTGRSVLVGTGIKVTIPMVELKSAAVPGTPMTWAVERDCIIVTCPQGHEMGITGPMYTRHTVDAEGRVSPGVMCPARECDFSQLCKLLDYTNHASV